MKKILTLIVLLSIPMLVLAWGRDSGGNFTFTGGAGNIVTTGSTISSTWANQSFLDVKSALSDSLSRSGSGGMLAPLTLFDSTTTTLDLRWDGANTTGWYHNAGTVGLNVAGTSTQTWTATGVTIPQPVTVSGGNVLVSNGGVIVSAGNVMVGSHLNIVTDTGISKDNGYLALAGSSGVSFAAAGTTVAFVGANYLDLGGYKIVSLGTPTANTDASTKAYVDTAVGDATNLTWTQITGCTGVTYTKLAQTVYVRGSYTTDGSGGEPCTGTVAVGSRPKTVAATGLAFRSGGAVTTVTFSISTAGVISAGTGDISQLYTIINFSYPAEQ